MKLIRLALGLPFLFAACNLNSSDEGKKEVTNFEDLPNCSSAGTTSGMPPLSSPAALDKPVRWTASARTSPQKMPGRGTPLP